MTEIFRGDPKRDADGCLTQELILLNSPADLETEFSVYRRQAEEELSRWRREAFQQQGKAEAWQQAFEHLSSQVGQALQRRDL